MKISHKITEQCPHVTDITVRIQTDDHHGAPPETVFDAEPDRSASVGYTPQYAAGWDAIFGKKTGGDA